MFGHLKSSVMRNVKSHAQSLLIDVKPAVKCRFVCEFFSSVDDMFDGVAVKRSDFVTDDCRTRFDGLTVNDFALSNQLSAGVNLKPAQVRMSLLGEADRTAFEASLLTEFLSKNTKKE